MSCVQQLRADILGIGQAWPSPQSSALASCYHCCQLQHLVMWHSLSHSIQDSANESIACTCCVLNCFLQHRHHLDCKPCLSAVAILVAYNESLQISESPFMHINMRAQLSKHTQNRQLYATVLGYVC